MPRRLTPLVKVETSSLYPQRTFKSLTGDLSVPIVTTLDSPVPSRITSIMTLKELLASLRKLEYKRRVRTQIPSVSRGTAFLDQQRFLPRALEKHYIGSMLYAFNFAEETQRAEGGRPLKVTRVLADDLVSFGLFWVEIIIYCIGYRVEGAMFTNLRMNHLLMKAYTRCGSNWLI